jgi:hypothetical protein
VEYRTIGSQTLVIFFAGWADTLTAGRDSNYGTAAFRRRFNYDYAVNYDSGAYYNGYFTGQIHNIAMMVAGARQMVNGLGGAGGGFQAVMSGNGTLGLAWAPAFAVSAQGAVAAGWGGAAFMMAGQNPPNGGRVSATRVVPRLEGNNPGELLADAYRHINSSTLNEAGRAELMEQFILQIENRVPGWRLAARVTGTDGSAIFMGEAAVISPEGQVFTGSIRPGSPGFTFGRGGALTPNYGLLKAR